MRLLSNNLLARDQQFEKQYEICESDVFVNLF